VRRGLRLVEELTEREHLRETYQSRSIDNQRFVRALRPLPSSLMREVEEKLRLLADL
jgi:hypothetical protein